MRRRGSFFLQIEYINIARISVAPKLCANKMSKDTRNADNQEKIKIKRGKKKKQRT
jgi:hypothetical protein